MRLHTLTLTLICILLGMPPGTAQPPASTPAPLGQIADRWEATATAAELQVERRIEIDDVLSPALRHAPALTPDALRAVLRAAGAQTAECQVLDNTREIVLICTYRYPLPAAGSATGTVPLPGDELLSFAADLPVSAAQGVQVQTAGQLTLQGVLVRLPPAIDQATPSGAWIQRSYAATGWSQLRVNTLLHLPPGSTGRDVSLPAISVETTTHYSPAPLAWLAWGNALFTLLVAAGLIFHVRAWPAAAPPAPDPTRVPRWRRLPARLAHTLLYEWPDWLAGLLRAAWALGLAALGLRLLALAWDLARAVNPDPVLTWPWLAAWLPGDPTGALRWPGWPLLLAVSGACALVLATGFWARREAARRLALGTCLAALLVLALLWAQALLAPPYAPLQPEWRLLAGEALLWSLALPAWSLNHPLFRRAFARGVPS